MKWLSGTGTGLAITAIGLAVACGGGGAKPPREVTADDLALMVLQREDVPADLMQLEDDSPGGVLQLNGDDGAQAVDGTFFQLSLDDANAGETVCIASDAILFESVEAAHRRFEGEREGFTAAAEGAEIEDDAVSRLGDEAFAVRFPLAAAGFCEPYDSEATEALFIMFRIRNVVGSLLTFVYEPGDPAAEALQLAQKQADRTEAVFVREDS